MLICANKGQTLLSAVLSLIVILFLLYTAFSGRMISEIQYVRMTIQYDTAFYLAEACVEEALLTIRTEANDPSTNIYKIFRDMKPAKIDLSAVHTSRTAQEFLPDKTVYLEVSAEILGIKPLADDLTPDSLDRAGHLVVSAKAQYDGGKSQVRVVKQFRIQDAATPNPLKKFGLILREFGISNIFGRAAVGELPADILLIINQLWRFTILVHGENVKASGFPFVRQRLSYFSPSWELIKDYFFEQGGYRFYGDVLISDAKDLLLKDTTITGAGRILSSSGRISLQNLIFHPLSFVGFGILSGGKIELSGFSQKLPALTSIFLPTGKIVIHDKSYVRGFLHLNEVDFPYLNQDQQSAVKMIKQDERLTKSQMVVVISGQTAVWDSGF